MSEATATLRMSPGWLLGERFDVAFIVGVSAVAILSGMLVLAEPSLFLLVLTLDLWLLGYHHVISTFTRLSFDKESLRTHRFLVFHLPFIVFAGCLLASWGIGVWVLGTIYLYWQWFHYTRQSWGISQAYWRKSGQSETEPAWFLQCVLYLLPLAGILHRSNQSPETFLGIEIHTLPVPDVVVWIAGLAAGVSIVAFAASRLRMRRRGKLPVAHTLYVSSHLVVFYFGYMLIDDITIGWLVLNVWHNLQYVLFVWMFNTRRFQGGIDVKARFLSTISQSKNWPYYFLVCLGISTVVYLPIYMASDVLNASLLPAIVIYMTINFHHYIVDSVIWKRPAFKRYGQR